MSARLKSGEMESDNLTIDGDMEEKAVVGWRQMYFPALKLEKSTKAPHSGKRSLHVILDTSVVSGIQQWVSELEPGRYYFEVWYKGSQFIIELQSMRASKQLELAGLGKKDWQKHQAVFDLPVGSEGVLIKFISRTNKAETEFWVDDCIL